MLSAQGLGVRASHHFLNSSWRPDGQGAIASMSKKKRGKVHFFLVHYTLTDPVNLTESLYKCQETLGVHTASLLCHSHIVLPHSQTVITRGLGTASFWYTSDKVEEENKISFGEGSN